MKFKASDRTHQVGKEKGKPILVPDIKTDEDIPQRVKDFFNDSYHFLENLVGKDNVIYVQVHYDEDTPHLHFYFMPIVNEVKKKVFETNSSGNIIYHKGIDKKGNKKMYPVQKKDKNGKNVFKTELQTSKGISEFDTNETLNPVKRKVIGYKDEDINNLIDDSKQTQKENSSNK